MRNLDLGTRQGLGATRVCIALCLGGILLLVRKTHLFCRRSSRASGTELVDRDLLNVVNDDKLVETILTRLNKRSPIKIENWLVNFFPEVFDDDQQKSLFPSEKEFEKKLCQLLQRDSRFRVEFWNPKESMKIG